MTINVRRATKADMPTVFKMMKVDSFLLKKNIFVSYEYVILKDKYHSFSGIGRLFERRWSETLSGR